MKKIYVHEVVIAMWALFLICCIPLAIAADKDYMWDRAILYWGSTNSPSYSTFDKMVSEMNMRQDGTISIKWKIAKHPSNAYLIAPSHYTASTNWYALKVKKETAEEKSTEPSNEALLEIINKQLAIIAKEIPAVKELTVKELEEAIEAKEKSK